MIIVINYYGLFYKSTKNPIKVAIFGSMGGVPEVTDPRHPFRLPPPPGGVGIGSPGELPEPGDRQTREVLRETPPGELSYGMMAMIFAPTEIY